MSTRSSIGSLFFATMALAMLAGCSPSASSLERGYSACGSVTCSPGQHCEQPSLSLCEDGCTTDLNCPTGQICDPDAIAFRLCLGAGAPDGGMVVSDGGFDALAACRAACEHFQTCGLAASEAAQCRTDCGTLTADQLAAIAQCGDVACTAVTGCLGVQCLENDDCDAEQSCVGYTCL